MGCVSELELDLELEWQVGCFDPEVDVLGFLEGKERRQSLSALIGVPPIYFARWLPYWDSLR